MAAGPADMNSPRVGLALAGGGPLGGTYEVGALIALDEALEGIDLHNLEVYVGVSAGAFVAANLANQFTMAQIARVFISSESDAHPISPSVFMRPAFAEYWRGLRTLPGAIGQTVFDFLRHPLDTGLLGAVANLSRCIPNAVFDNDPLRAALADIWRTRGHTDDFRELEQKLFVVAADLDTGESVVFGAEGHMDTPISRAVQASTALPGLFPPVEIEGRYFVDGGLQKTLHASVALDTDIELLLCINPIVPYDARAERSRTHRTPPRLANFGLPTVMSQTFRSLIHSRMDVGMGQYDNRYPGKDLILFEPKREDSRMFFNNVFSYSNRRHICEHAYQATRADLLARRKEIVPILERHGIKLRTKVLQEKHRRFDTGLIISDDKRRIGLYKNQVTNRLSEALDTIEREIIV